MNSLFRHVALIRSANFAPALASEEIGLVDLLALMAISVPLYIFSMVVFDAPTKAFADVLSTFLSVFFFVVAAVAVTLFYRGAAPEKVMGQIFLALIAGYLITLMVFSLNLFFTPASNLSFLGEKWVPNRFVLSLLYTLPSVVLMGINTRLLISKEIAKEKAPERRVAYFYAALIGGVALLCVAYFIWQTVFFAENPLANGWNGTLVKIIEKVGARFGLGI
jgi:hypothetical protein